MNSVNLHIRVGGNGRRSGLAVGKVPEVELRVLVLPKVWRETTDTPQYCIAVLDGTLCVSVICWEGDRLDLDGINVGHRGDAFRACLQAIEAKAEEIADQGSGEVDDKADGDAPPDNVDGDSESYAPLLRVFSGTGTEAPKRCGTAHFISEWDCFYRLWYYSCCHIAARRSPEWSQRRRYLSEVSGDVATSSLLVPFLHELFVRECEGLLDHVRPGYSRITARCSFIRGRLNAVSASVLSEGGPISCQCTFDDFSLDTPMQQVVLAALNVVSDFRGEIPAPPDTRATASWLADRLDMVTRLSPLQAIRKGEVLAGRLAKADAAWETCLDLACLVLQGHKGLSPVAGRHRAPFGWSKGEGTEAFVFDVNTDHLWENIVRAAWPGIGDTRNQRRRAESVHPWTPKSNPAEGRGMKADGVSRCDGALEIIDAKYSLPERAQKKKQAKRNNLRRRTRAGVRKRLRKQSQRPEAAEQRQMYTYAYEYGKIRKADTVNCFLVYPKARAETPPEDLLENDLQANEGKFLLRRLRISFPCKQSTRSKRAWARHLNLMRTEIIAKRVRV